jgi:hypothetical protein
LAEAAPLREVLQDRPHNTGPSELEPKSLTITHVRI